jgi:hypothetical protein
MSETEKLQAKIADDIHRLYKIECTLPTSMEKVSRISFLANQIEERCSQIFTIENKRKGV